MDLQTYYITVAIVIFVGIPIILGVLGYLWNKKWRPRQNARGVAVDRFSNIVKRVIRFATKEDPGTIAPKKASEKTQKLLSTKKVYLALLLIGLILILARIELAWIPLTILGLTLWVRASRVFKERHTIFTRMFEVANSSFHYGRGAELNPWSYVQIQEWADMTVPQQTIVTYPASYKADSLMAREGFERHFNSTVTEANMWTYKWETSKGKVTADPVKLLPELAHYQGSEKYPWHVFPIGVGASGIVSYDVTQSPHALVAGSTGSGKNYGIMEDVFTSNKGWITVGELEVGDTLFGVDGKPTKVSHLHPIITPAKAYKITFKNGETATVDADHLWETETRKARVSRFTNVKKAPERDRVYWLSNEVVDKVQTALDAATNEDTISIVEVAELTGKTETTNLFYDIAKQVGPAESVQSVVKFHYNAQTVVQKQTLMHVNKDEFIELYNGRKQTKTTKAKPLTKSQFDKLVELSTEIRSTDTLTLDSVLEYLGTAFPTTVTWVKENADTTLNASEMVADLVAKAEGKYSLLPDKIFSIENREYVTKRDIASLLNIEVASVEIVFRNIYIQAVDKFKKSVDVELIVPEKTLTRPSVSYNTFPKRLFLQRVLENNETPVNDQQFRREMRSVKTTQEIFETVWSDDKQTHRNHSIRRTQPLVMDEIDLPITPYVLGAWLGDGKSNMGAICGEDKEVFDYIEQLGYSPTETSRNKVPVSVSKPNTNQNFRLMNFPKLSQELYKIGLRAGPNWRLKRDGEVKYIPGQYFISSIEQRRELLRGLLDTDGTVAGSGGIEFATSNPMLRDDVKRLVASLGYIPYIRSKVPTYTYKDEKKQGKTAYTVAFQAPPSDRLFGLERKNLVHAARFTGDNFVNSYADAHLIVDIQEVAPVPMRCISVDAPDRLFLVSDSMIPTHNSVLQRNILFHCIQHNDVWRFLGVDVKVVELTPFTKYNKTVLGVGTNVEDGLEIVKYAHEVMTARYEEMGAKGVNNFTKLIDPETGKHPYAVLLMVDETFAFLAPKGVKTDEGKMVDQQKGEASSLLSDIARLGRAAGIHLLLATQRPDATVISGELKNNLDTRIAAGRLDSTPSSMVLDSGAATMLPGHIKGRGVIRLNGNNEQFQGFFADAPWIDDWLKKNPGHEPELDAQWALEAAVAAEVAAAQAAVEPDVDFEDAEKSDEDRDKFNDPARLEIPESEIHLAHEAVGEDTLHPDLAAVNPVNAEELEADLAAAEAAKPVKPAKVSRRAKSPAISAPVTPPPVVTPSVEDVVAEADDDMLDFGPGEGSFQSDESDFDSDVVDSVKVDEVLIEAEESPSEEEVTEDDEAELDAFLEAFNASQLPAAQPAAPVLTPPATPVRSEPASAPVNPPVASTPVQQAPVAPAVVSKPAAFPQRPKFPTPPPK